MPTKTKKSISKFLDSESNIKNELKGGLKPKDDPDKLDKEEFEEVDEIDENEEEENEEEEVEGAEGEEDEEEDEGDEEENEAEEENGEEFDDDCIYKLTKPSKKKKNNMNIDIDIEDNFEDEDDGHEINNKYVKPSERKTKPYLFEFERVRLLGDRARQLSMGAKPMIKNIEIMDPRAIAKMELEKKIIPLIVLRELPNGQIEKWKVSELNFF